MLSWVKNIYWEIKMFEFFKWQMKNQVQDHSWMKNPDSKIYKPMMNLNDSLQGIFTLFRKNLSQMSYNPITYDSIVPFIKQEYTELTPEQIDLWFYEDQSVEKFKTDIWAHGYTPSNQMRQLLIQTNLCEHLQLDESTTKFRIHEQRPGQIWPLHLDRKKDQEFGRRPYKRYWIFFDDWQPGHAIQLGDQFIKWRAGDVWGYFDTDVPHGTANFGHESRFIMMVTGALLPETG